MTEEALTRALDRLVPPLAFEPDWDDVMERATAAIPLRRNRRLWYAVAAAAVLLGLLVSPAFGLGERLVDLFTGSPAPKPVKRELSFGTNVANSKVDELMHEKVDSVVLTAQARGLFEVSTPAGVLRIWGAPTSDGGFCTYMRFVGAAHGSLGCDTPNRNAGPLLGGADELKKRGKAIVYVSGRVREEIASVELRLADGSSRPVPLVRPYFFRVLQPGEEPEALVGRNPSGDVVANLSAHFESFDPSLVLPPTYPVGPAHQLAVLETRIGRVTFAVAPGPDRKRCWILTAVASEGISCRPVARAIEFDYGPEYNVQQTQNVVFLAGFVSPRVGSLELHFEDGDSVDLDFLEDDYFLYVVPRSRYGTGHRPTVLIARDEDGNVLSRRRIANG
jgi:hypothetical protein